MSGHALAEQVVAHVVGALLGEAEVVGLVARRVGVTLHDDVGVGIAVQRVGQAAQPLVGTSRERRGAGVEEQVAREHHQQTFVAALDVGVGDGVDLLGLLLHVVADQATRDTADRGADQGTAAPLVVVDGGARCGAGERSQDGTLGGLAVENGSGVGLATERHGAGQQQAECTSATSSRVGKHTFTPLSFRPRRTWFVAPRPMDAV